MDGPAAQPDPVAATGGAGMPPGSTSPPDDLPGIAGLLMQSRQTVLPKRLAAPGPDPFQLQQLLQAAATAPDHGQLRPWRLVLVPQEARGQLADAFAQALQQRDPAATLQQMEQAREKAYRAPLLLLLVVDSGCGDPEVDLNERLVSAGCALQNMLLMATAQGMGSALTSGKALKSEPLRALFRLAGAEHAVCFISIGSAQSRGARRSRPEPRDLVSALGADRGTPAPEAQASVLRADPRG